MIVTVMTLFPDFFKTPLEQSILHRASGAGIVTVETVNIRDYALDKHAVTDDRPYGGGPGMVLLVEPVDRALQAWHEKYPKSKYKTLVVLTSAKGALFTQQLAQQYTTYDAIAILCGHYEGVDERIAEHLVDAEVRIGDFVLTGGEPAALAMLDAVIRLLPGAVGNSESIQDESHSIPGQLGYPQYSRPAEYRGWKVPEILLGGHHARIEEWRTEQKKLTV
ncbi:tRNA (guanosine(37)-N1)-methyltransferase TrmD [Candidatus Woesebacteria bacterium]|nr:tRNA (guanosine(37)-N1)-methyltransferase TrmD [Candidatus Woesebacteria bacterium]